MPPPRPPRRDNGDEDGGEDEEEHGEGAAAATANEGEAGTAAAAPVSPQTNSNGKDNVNAATGFGSRVFLFRRLKPIRNSLWSGPSSTTAAVTRTTATDA